ncbi:MAG: HAD family hydrolase [Phycisphaeraceae bacterium JB051]
MSSNNQLIIFDLGRVMVDICNNWQEAASLACVKLEMADYLKAHEQISGPLLTAMETGKIDIDQFSDAVSQLVNKPAADIKAAFLMWLKEPMPGMVDFVKQLKADGIKTACLSNTSHMHWDMMLDPASEHYLALDEIFDYPMASHLIGIMKPDDGIYQYAQEHTGFEASQIVFFDDNQANIDKAQSLGWNATLITQDKPVIDQVKTALNM